jgi:regulator of RNase E activity RraB
MFNLDNDKAEVKAKLDIVIEYLNSASDILYNIEGTVPNENYELLEGIISDLDSFKRFL